MYCYDYRGHTVAAVCNSFQLSKDCGFKVLHNYLNILAIERINT